MQSLFPQGCIGRCTGRLAPNSFDVASLAPLVLLDDILWDQGQGFHLLGLFNSLRVLLLPCRDLRVPWVLCA